MFEYSNYGRVSPPSFQKLCNFTFSHDIPKGLSSFGVYHLHVNTAERRWKHTLEFKVWVRRTSHRCYIIDPARYILCWVQSFVICTHPLLLNYFVYKHLHLFCCRLCSLMQPLHQLEYYYSKLALHVNIFFNFFFIFIFKVGGCGWYTPCISHKSRPPSHHIASTFQNSPPKNTKHRIWKAEVLAAFAYWHG